MARRQVVQQTALWGKAGVEPDLREVLADPLVHLVMRRDRVSMAALCNVVAVAQARLRQGAPRRGLCGGLAA
ncbi:MAG TPA: hypothetical protein VMU42_09325 [Candidatus Sulfotelmatobacter sp.]|nr:hypothetical protein [Candidatus Sulfotelmatobacter sp.]